MALAPTATTPIYRQIYERIRAAILAGQLRPGTRLPSWNTLASELRVARGTVKAAYDWLAGEGYVVGRGPAGTVVNPALAFAPSTRDPVARELPAAVPEHFSFSTWGAAPLPFQLGIPALDQFPRKVWARLMARHAARLAPEQMTYPDPAGDPCLRQAIASYLAVARSIKCSPSSVFVTIGFAGALGVITRALLSRGDAVWLEDPGFPRTREALTLAGAQLVPVRVDANGIDVEQGIARARRARLAVVTPSHQAPLGIRLSLPRRLALLDWAVRTGAGIIEDDYLSEFRLGGPPLPALASLDATGQVIYVGTFSKVLLPGLRLGYMVVPPAQQQRFSAIVAHLAPVSSPLTQATLADFMAEGHFARHLRRMRALYADRRDALLEALRTACGNLLSIDDRDTGMHVIARLPPGTDDENLVRRARAAGLGVAALSTWSIEAACGPGLLLSFTNIPPNRAPALAAKLRALLSSGAQAGKLATG